MLGMPARVLFGVKSQGSLVFHRGAYPLVKRGAAAMRTCTIRGMPERRRIHLPD